MSCKNMLCKNRAKQSEDINRVKSYSPRTGKYTGKNAPTKKTGPEKKEWQVGQDNDSTEAADGNARARADGAVVLNLRRGPGSREQGMFCAFYLQSLRSPIAYAPTSAQLSRALYPARAWINMRALPEVLRYLLSLQHLAVKAPLVF